MLIGPADPSRPTRRRFVAGGAALLAAPAMARSVDLRLPGGPSDRPLTRAFPQKGEMILQRSRPPLLETPMAVFDQGVFTPNDRFFVRWHWADFPTSIDVKSYRLKVRGAVTSPLSLTLDDLLAMPRFEIAAVNQCAGNSRGLFEPRIPGAQWRHGAMGNAKWTGVRLRDVLDRAGVRRDAVAVRFGGLDQPLLPDAPDFTKSLPVDRARDGEVMIAFAMNGEPLPLLNGFPLRLVVPGWFSTYWIKMLDDIELLSAPDTGYFMLKGYKVPANPAAHVAPGTKDFASVPITRMAVRSWITSIADGATAPFRPVLPVRGIAMGGDTGVASVELSSDGGRSWQAARLGPDEGKYSFRRFDGTVPVVGPGPAVLMSRCTSSSGEVQPMTPNWNPGGYLRNVVEATSVTLV